MAKIRFFLFFAFLSALLFSGCQPPPSPPVSSKTWFDLKVGKTPFRAQLAVSQEEMMTGLMHRPSLGENDGMLFVYGTPGRMSFWMKNTHIPLDVGFFTPDRILREVVSMKPYDLTPVHSSREDISYALEMNLGWFARNSLPPGVLLDERLLDDALRKRSAR